MVKWGVKIMGKYLKEGWLNFDYLIKMHCPFIFAVGARGIGKTYSAIEYLIKNNIKFVFVRRSKVQADFISSDVSHVLKPYLETIGQWDQCTTTGLKDIGYLYYLGEELVGMCTSLSMVANIRGFNGDDFDAIVFDEFIPKQGERVICDEGTAICDLYETVNRNRELQGREPVKLICLSNSNSGNNPLFNYFNLANTYAMLQKNEKEVYINNVRACCIVRYDASPISAEKQQTALYKFTKGTRYYEMAINNVAEDISDFTPVKVNIKEYAPIVKYGEIVIYKHKADRLYYVTRNQTGACREITADQKGKYVFQHDYWPLKQHYVENNVQFTDYSDEIRFRLAFDFRW